MTILFLVNYILCTCFNISPIIHAATTFHLVGPKEIYLRQLIHLLHVKAVRVYAVPFIFVSTMARLHSRDVESESFESLEENCNENDVQHSQSYVCKWHKISRCNYNILPALASCVGRNDL